MENAAAQRQGAEMLRLYGEICRLPQRVRGLQGVGQAAQRKTEGDGGGCEDGEHHSRYIPQKRCLQALRQEKTEVKT